MKQYHPAPNPPRNSDERQCMNAPYGGARRCAARRTGVYVAARTHAHVHACTHTHSRAHARTLARTPHAHVRARAHTHTHTPASPAGQRNRRVQHARPDLPHTIDCLITIDCILIYLLLCAKSYTRLCGATILMVGNKVDLTHIHASKPMKTVAFDLSGTNEIRE